MNQNNRPDTNAVSGLLFLREITSNRTRQSDDTRSGFHRVAGAAHGADDILHVRKIERLA